MKPTILFRLSIPIFLMTTLCFIPNNQAGGYIKFSDNVTIKFKSFNYVYAAGGNGAFDANCYDVFPIFYQNSWRLMPINNLRSIKIVEFKAGNDSGDMDDLKLQVETKTGTTAVYSLANLDYLKFDIYDDLTGEVVKQTLHPIAKPSGPRIIEIVFN